MSSKHDTPSAPPTMARQRLAHHINTQHTLRVAKFSRHIQQYSAPHGRLRMSLLNRRAKKTAFCTMLTLVRKKFDAITCARTCHPTCPRQTTAHCIHITMRRTARYTYLAEERDILEQVHLRLRYVVWVHHLMLAFPRGTISDANPVLHILAKLLRHAVRKNVESQPCHSIQYKNSRSLRNKLASMEQEKQFNQTRDCDLNAGRLQRTVIRLFDVDGSITLSQVRWNGPCIILSSVQ